MHKLTLLLFIFFSTFLFAQESRTHLTILYFEDGFDSTKVIVIAKRDTLYSGNVSSNYDKGYSLKLEIPNKSSRTIIFKVGDLKKKVKISADKFYRISVRDNKLLIYKASEKPIYI